MDKLQYMLIAALIIIGICVLYYIMYTMKKSEKEFNSENSEKESNSIDSLSENIKSDSNISVIIMITEEDDYFTGRMFDLENRKILLAKEKDKWYGFSDLYIDDQKKLMDIINKLIPVKLDDVTNICRSITIKNGQVQMYLKNSKGLEMTYDFADEQSDDKKMIIDTISTIDHFQKYWNSTVKEGLVYNNDPIKGLENEQYFKLSDW
jgi:hypothetical protein